jgi:hypothetical protein
VIITTVRARPSLRQVRWPARVTLLSFGLQRQGEEIFGVRSRTSGFRRREHKMLDLRRPSFFSSSFSFFDLLVGIVVDALRRLPEVRGAQPAAFQQPMGVGSDRPIVNDLERSARVQVFAASNPQLL